MARKKKDINPKTARRATTATTFPQPRLNEWPDEDEIRASEDAELNRDEEDDEESGEQGGEAEGGGKGAYFEESEDRDFDQTELQGMSIPIFRNALKKGLKLVNKITKQSERYLRNFLPDPELRSRVVEVALSERGHPTLLLDKGEIIQYQLAQGKLERVRVTPDLDAERAVKYAMAGFLAAGESIDPKHVKFGRSPEFRERMMPIWTREWKKIQAAQAQLANAAAPRKDANFKQSVEPQSQSRPEAPAQSRENKLHMSAPQAARFRTFEP